MWNHTSVIAAIDTNGNSYFTVLHGNVDSDVFSLFVTWLVKILDVEDVNWWDNTVLILDGASIHWSETTSNMLIRLGVSYMISAPYNFRGAPVEMFFSALKANELNPGSHPIGKR